MIKTILAAAVSFGLLSAADAQVNFDQGVSIDSFVSQAANPELAAPAPRLARTYTSRDCARFSFGPGDNEMLSERVWLRSQEYVTECHTVMQPGPNGGTVPVQTCYERPGMVWSQAGQIKILPRKLFAWERETFELCLEGPWMDLFVHEAGYKYSVRRVGSYDALFELSPKNKIAMRSDENGLDFGAFSYAGGKYTFKVSDKWAKEYAGEKVSIKVDLFRNHANWFDGYRGSKEFTFDAAGGYEMSFSEEDLEMPELPDGVSGGHDRGVKKYYLKWGFKRLGSISKDNFVKKGETPSIEAK